MKMLSLNACKKHHRNVMVIILCDTQEVVGGGGMLYTHSYFVENIFKE